MNNHGSFFGISISGHKSQNSLSYLVHEFVDATKWKQFCKENKRCEKTRKHTTGSVIAIKDLIRLSVRIFTEELSVNLVIVELQMNASNGGQDQLDSTLTVYILRPFDYSSLLCIHHYFNFNEFEMAIIFGHDIGHFLRSYVASEDEMQPLYC